MVIVLGLVAEGRLQAVRAEQEAGRPVACSVEEGVGRVWVREEAL